MDNAKHQLILHECCALAAASESTADERGTVATARPAPNEEHVALNSNVSPKEITSGPANLTLAESERWVIVGSSDDLNAAISLAQSYKHKTPNVVVLKSINGRYAVALGPLQRDAAVEYLSRLKNERSIPIDAYLSRGARMVSIEWR
jgi:hypothetical protein